MIRLTLISALLALLAGASAAQDPYLIQPGDQLRISVLEDPGLDTTALVAPDGRIAMPLVGTVLAEGRTPEQVQAVIRQGLARDFVAPPTVTVSLVGVGDGPELPTVYVIGEVGNPGRYAVDLPIDILQMLAITGGPGTFAAADRIQIRRRVGGVDQVLLFDYESVEDGAAPVDPLLLADGDVIVVPQRGLFE